MGIISTLSRKTSDVSGKPSTPTTAMAPQRSVSHSKLSNALPNNTTAAAAAAAERGTSSHPNTPPNGAQSHQLRIRTEGMHIPKAATNASGAQTAGVKPTQGGLAGPTPIKRNTSFSQRLHSFLHRDKSTKAPNPRRHVEQPTIAYRTPTTQTQLTDRSDASGLRSGTNSPPSVSPRSTHHQHKESLPKAYHAQRNFEPMTADSIFAISDANLRSVNAGHAQCPPPVSQPPPQPAPVLVSGQDDADRITQGMQQASLEPVAESSSISAHTMSREPSQATLNHSASTEIPHDQHAPAHQSAASPSRTGTPPTTKPAADARTQLEGKTLSKSAEDASVRHNPSAPAANGHPHFDNTSKPVSPAGATAPNQLSRSTTAPHKKPGPVYSSHKATLNQFGRQTKVIGKGTGGTVRLLQGVEVDARPPSLRSGPPSSHHGDEPHAYTPSEHRLFAVKEFRKRRQDETPRSYMKKVTSEFCIGSSIHNENVIETLDLIFEGERVYEIMEYCPHDLFTFVAMGDMDLDETFCWFKQVCQGVQYLHKIGIAHRDLKLENCLLTERGIVKIIDFGCATVFKTPFQKEPSKVVGVCGSDPYIAPEVLQSRRQLPYYAQVADIWSVGIMYMCMTLLKFPWRIAETENDRNYGSYIRDWPRGREKLLAQLPTLRHDGKSVIEGMVHPSSTERMTMDQVLDSDWMKEIEVCHTNCPARSHTHHMKAE